MKPSYAAFAAELESLEKQGLARSLSSTKDNIVNLSSNDYLALSKHGQVIASADEAVQNFGTGGTSSRLMAGTNALHQNLETRLASFLDKEAALVFSSGYHTNTGVLPALAGPEDLILFDRLSHASIIDGIRLSRATFFGFEHNDLEDLENQLKKRAAGRRHVWIVTEGYFSMDGDAPPLREIVDLADRTNALVYLDEAHSLGVTGPQGRGLAAREKVLSRIDVFVGTLSKSLGSQGGFVAATKVVINLLLSKCRSFKYTTALAPACAASASTALRLLPQMEDRREKIFTAAETLRYLLKNLGFDTLKSCSPIVPVWTGDVEATRKLSEHLFSCGFFVPSIRPPTVPVGEGRVRLSMTYDNIGDVEKIANAFARYSKTPGVKLGSKN